VEDIQRLLNNSDMGFDGHIWSKTDFLDEDGKFGPLTDAKVREFQKVSGLSVDGMVGPQTNVALFAPQADQVDRAQGIATNWTFIARGAVQTLRNWVEALQFGQPAPGGLLATYLEALRTHFHIDLPNPPGQGRRVPTSPSPFDLLVAADQLFFVQQVFDDVSFILDKASIRDGKVFHSVGQRVCDSLKVGTISAFNSGGIPKSEGTVLICFPPSFAVTTAGLDFFRTVHQQASTVLHECCHYVHPRSLGADFVTDFAYGLPAFAGQPNTRVSTKNYLQLNANESVHNAESYNLFAEHVTFGRDTRFGRLSDDAATFACGSQQVSD
jgi:hypothetical protein